MAVQYPVRSSQILQLVERNALALTWDEGFSLTKGASFVPHCSIEPSMHEQHGVSVVGGRQGLPAKPLIVDLVGMGLKAIALLCDEVVEKVSPSKSL